MISFHWHTFIQPYLWPNSNSARAWQLKSQNKNQNKETDPRKQKTTNKTQKQKQNSIRKQARRRSNFGHQADQTRLCVNFHMVMITRRLADGYPTLANYLTQPHISSIIKIMIWSRFIDIHSSNHTSLCPCQAGEKQKHRKQCKQQNRTGGDRISDIEPTRQEIASIFTWWWLPDGYPTLVNHLTRPHIHSITNSHRITLFSCWWLPDGCEPRLHSRIQTGLTFSAGRLASERGSCPTPFSLFYGRYPMMTFGRSEILTDMFYFGGDGYGHRVTDSQLNNWTCWRLKGRRCAPSMITKRRLS
jgi:hypothetical protein